MSNDIRRAADALYQRGYEDAKKERDFDPRKTTEWLVVVGLPSTAGQRGEVVPEGWGMAAFRHKWEACETQCECKVCGTVFGAMPPPSVQKGGESHFAKPRVQPNAQPGHCSHARTYNGRVCCDCGAEVDPATQNFGRYGTATPAPSVPDAIVEAPDCPTCEGAGYVEDSKECSRCGMRGCRTIDCERCGGTGKLAAAPEVKS